MKKIVIFISFWEYQISNDLKIEGLETHIFCKNVFKSSKSNLLYVQVFF